MTDNQKRILELLADKKITTEEAYRLLSAMENGGTEPRSSQARESVQKVVPKYLRVTVMPGENADPKHADRVNVRVPMSLIRAGIKLTSLIPAQARDKIDEALKDKGVRVRVSDPHVRGENVLTVEDALGGADAALVMTAHREYLAEDWGRFSTIMRLPLLVDDTGLVPPPDGLTYVGMGRKRS